MNIYVGYRLIVFWCVLLVLFIWLINHLLLQDTTVLYCFMQIVIVLIVYSSLFDHYCNQTMRIYSYVTYIVGICSFWNHIDDIGSVIKNWDGFCDA